MTTQTDLAVRNGTAELARPAPIEDFRPLDKYAGGFSDERPRMPWLATISAGRLVPGRNGQPIPRASRKEDPQWIHLTDEDRERAPGLVAALEAGGFRSLDVAVPFDDPGLFLQQHFEKRSASRLEAYGDEHTLTEILLHDTGKRDSKGEPITTAEHRAYPRGSADYDRVVKDPGTKVSVSFFFVLAKWDRGEPRIYFPATDGLGVYRLRFTSRHSLREILAALRQISGLTRGRLTGIPLHLTLDWREVADPKGARRTIGVWKPRFMPPQTLEITPELWQDLAKKALATGDKLRLPAPVIEGIDDAIEDLGEADLDAPTEADLELVEQGGVCDYDHWIRRWHAAVKGSKFEEEDWREDFLRAYTEGHTDSLATFLADATEAEATALVSAVTGAIAAERIPRLAERYTAVFGTEEDRDAVPVRPREEPAPAAAPATSEIVKACGLCRAEGPCVASPGGWICADREACARRRLDLGEEPAAVAIDLDTLRERVLVAGEIPSDGELWALVRALEQEASELGLRPKPTLSRLKGADLARAAHDLAASIKARNEALDAELAAKQAAF